MINYLRRVLLILLTTSLAYSAQLPPLIIGVQSFIPPFIIQGPHNEFYGFDIDLVSALCKIMDRPCQFQVMTFEELIPAAAAGKVDAALSALTITAERSRRVNFSLPYLLSYSRFLTNDPNLANQPFSLNLLKRKKIGIETGTIFGDQIKEMKVIEPIIKEYATTDELLEGLQTKAVDFLLLDSPSAFYWAANSAGAFLPVGQPFLYGSGFGIAIDPAKEALLTAFNKALLIYENSPEYQQNYNRYLSEM